MYQTNIRKWKSGAPFTCIGGSGDQADSRLPHRVLGDKEERRDPVNGGGWGGVVGW